MSTSVFQSFIYVNDPESTGHKKQMMKEIDDKMLFRYFSSATTAEEEHAINDWLLLDKANEERLRESYRLWEALLFSGEDSERRGLRRRRRRTVIRRIGLALLNAAALAAFFVVAGHVMTEREEDRLASTMNRIEIPAGGKMDFTLSDGTKVCLNAGAVLSYPMQFSRSSREVSVSGEAWFDVAHDEDKPFVVKTFLSEIEVLGTKFNVNADEESREFSVALLEGSIRLRSDAGERLMTPGEKVRITGRTLVCEACDMTRETRWMDGVIGIGGMTFPEIMREMERAFGVKIVIEREDMPEIGFSDAEIHRSEGVESALRSLQYAGVRFSYTHDFATETIYIR